MVEKLKVRPKRDLYRTHLYKNLAFGLYIEVTAVESLKRSDTPN